MTQTETLGLLDEIESFVTDQLQVVSYKWLSRNFLLSSNTAKRLLKEFVEKQGKGLEVVYIVSGWLKSSPFDYHTRLVSSSKLPEVEQEFNGNYSVHIYSVQASIPMDPASIWNAEFVQAEELFKQPSAVDNCLRDNRFCGISNSFVKRNVEGTSSNVTAPVAASVSTTVQSKGGLNSQEGAMLSNQGKRLQQPSPKVSLQVKSESNTAAAQDQSAKSSVDKDKSFPMPAKKMNGQSEKSMIGSGGSLKKLWGHVSVKAEDDSAKKEVKNHINDLPVAQKPVHDANNKGGIDEETEDDHFKRATRNNNKKRKVIFDLSDEEYEDAISLASPSSPKVDSRPDGKQNSEDSDPEKPDASIARETKADELEVREEDKQSTVPVDTSGIRKDDKSTTSSMEKIQTTGSEAEVNPSKSRATQPHSSPKRKKVLKSRIDDRGREVTEVVWEETETKKVETDTKKKEDTDTNKKLNNDKSTGAVNRAVAQKKSPAMGNAGGKPGNKKGGKDKDPKQGNIMSFFKRV